jgi:hypothetical protein
MLRSQIKIGAGVGMVRPTLPFLSPFPGVVVGLVRLKTPAPFPGVVVGYGPGSTSGPFRNPNVVVRSTSGPHHVPRSRFRPDAQRVGPVHLWTPTRSPIPLPSGCPTWWSGPPPDPTTFPDPDWVTNTQTVN